MPIAEIKLPNVGNGKLQCLFLYNGIKTKLTLGYKNSYSIKFFKGAKVEQYAPGSAQKILKNQFQKSILKKSVHAIIHLNAAY